MDHHTILNQHRNTTARQLYEITSTIKNIDASQSNSLCLQQHRAIAVNQLRTITSTIVGLEELLADKIILNPPTFSVNDKVISLSAPNKNRIGFVTKVTQSYIHVNPINNKYKPFKKITENLSHFPQREHQPPSKVNSPSALTGFEKTLPLNTIPNTHPSQLSPPPPPLAKTHTTLPITSSSPDTSTTLSVSSTLPTPKQSSSTRLSSPTPSISKPIQVVRKRKRVSPTRSSSIARKARCARPDTRQQQNRHSKRQR